MKEWATKHQYAVRKHTVGGRERATSGINALKDLVDERYKAWLKRRGYTDSTLGDIIASEYAERMGEARR